ncbi:serine hydrolase [Phenylobacterium sp.]|uniref:serine hydrolase n=1 Tax=Phenylobacterium sp. TaxID=1871053 RepID=UPI00398371A8
MIGFLQRLWAQTHGQRRPLIVGLALLVTATGASGLVAVNQTTDAPVLQSIADTLPARAPPQAPEALQAKLEGLAQGFAEPVGIAVTEVERGWTAGVDAEGFYPQQSVSKLWVAIAVLRAVDAGRITLEQLAVLTQEDRSVFSQPVAYKIGQTGFVTPISDLLRRAIVESDNAANDKLMRELGGSDAVTQALTEMQLSGIVVGAYERDLQSLIAGLSWRPEYGIGWNFQAAREQLPDDWRDQALASYLADPLDGAQPAAITRTLAQLRRGELLSANSTNVLLGLMNEVRTGPRRLKGGLPVGWAIAHKTGTGQDWRGHSIGINDVGLLTAPDGRVYAVAVMMRRTRKAVPERLAFMQAVTRAVAESWEADQPRPWPADVSVAAAVPAAPATAAGN